MKDTKDETVFNEKPNHRGNFAITVSFDVYGKLPQKIVNEFVGEIERAFKREFYKRREEHAELFGLDIENITWE